MRRQWQAATALTFGLAFLLTFPGMLPGRVLLPLDHPRDLGAWKADPDHRYEISNKIVSDPIYEYLAWDTEIRRLLASGRLPWRSRWAGDGAHLYANPETALLFPFTWPRILLGERGWVFTAFLKLWAAGLGLWWLARLLGSEWRLALCGAAVYAMSGYMTVWLLFPHTNVFAVLPWLAGCALRFGRQPSPRRSAAVVATAALATAGGHPETLFHGVVGTALFMILIGTGKRLLALGALAFAGFALMAVQLVPFAVALSKSDIVKTRSSAEHRPVRLFAAAAQVLPGLLGSPLRGELDLSGVAQPEAENFNERNAGYAGAITLLVIVLAWRKLSRQLRIGLLIGVATLVVAWKVPLLDAAVHSLPLFEVAANERFPLVFVLFASVALPQALAIVAADAPRRKLGISIAAAGLLLFLAAAAPALPGGRELVVKGARRGIAHMQQREFLRKPPAYYEQRLDQYLEGLQRMSIRRMALPFLLIGITGAALHLRRHRAGTIAAAVVIEMFVFAWGYAPAVHARDGARMPPAVADIRRLDPQNQFLIAASEHVYDANLGTIHGVRDLRSYDVLQEHSRIERLVSLSYDRVSRGFPPALPPASVAPLAAAGVRFFLSRQHPPGTARVGGSPAPAVGLFELPEARPTPFPENTPPQGLAVGAAISTAALIAAVALVAFLPYHRL